jgi:hypothetical protein
MTLRRKCRYRTDTVLEIFNDGIVLRGKKPNRPVFAVELRRHWPGVSILQPVKAKHHCHIGFQGLPKSLL